MAAGTGGRPSVTRVSFGVTTSDWANAGRGGVRAAGRSRHDSLGMCAPTGDVGGQSGGRASPIYSPPHSFPRTLDDGEGGRVTDYRYPDSHVFYRKLGRSYPRIVRGEGCWLYDEQGKGYLDAVGGAYVANLGHSNPEIAEALARQAREFGYVSATPFTHGPVEELARELAATLPGELDKLYFLSSGSEAVEAALKLARQYWIEAGKPGKHRIIALSPSYHGNTLLALSASAREQYKLPFREWLVDGEHIPPPYPYRCRCPGDAPTAPAPHRPAAAPERFVDAIANGSGSLLHGQTFSFHPVACAAGLAAVRLLKRDRLVQRCAKLGRVLQRRLATLAELPHVGDVRGRGLLAGIEFVEDKASRAPFPRAAKFVEAFTEAAHGAGLVVWPNVGHADGVNGDLVAVAPPFIITEQEIEELVIRFTRAHAVALKAVKAGVR